MEEFREIIFELIAYAGVVFGLVGLGASLLLLVSPSRLQVASRLMNRTFSIEAKMTGLNNRLTGSQLLYTHNFLSGVALMAGSLFVLYFLFRSRVS